MKPREYNILIVENNFDDSEKLHEIILADRPPGFSAMRLKPFVAESEPDARIQLSKIKRPTGVPGAQAKPFFDLVLLDMHLGRDEREGLDLLRWMQSQPVLKPIPVIAVSKFTEPELIIECLLAGAQDYLTKPVPEDGLNLLVRVENALLRYAQWQRMTTILNAIFPAPVARLYTTDTDGEYIPHRHYETAVLFTDIEGFTSYCSGRPPDFIFGQLGILFGHFEVLARKWGIEKIKTIGDAFMAAAGLFPEEDEHLPHEVRVMPPELRCVEFARDIIAFAQPQQFPLRVGIHVGMLTSGFPGRQRYLFDLIGETVNLASRVEGKARSNGIALTEKAYSLAVKERFGILESTEEEMKNVVGKVKIYHLPCGLQ